MADKKISQLTGATTPLAGTEVLPVVQSGATVKVAVSDLTAGRTVSASSVVTTGSVGAGGAIAGASSTPVVQVKNASFNSFNGQDFRLYQNIYFDGTNYRYITANPGGFMAQYQNNWDWYVSTDVSPSAGGVATTSNILTLNDNGNLTFKTGNLVQGTAAKGVNFTANTGAAGMTSQLLNWYEEGTWTPASGVGSATSVTGSYTRIGRQVTVTGSLVFPVQTDSNQAQITGLPFTISSTSGPAGLVRYSDYGTMFYLYGESNNTKITFYAVATSPTAVTYTDMSGKRVDFSMIYFV